MTLGSLLAAGMLLTAAGPALSVGEVRTTTVSAPAATLDCRAALGDTALRWEVELDGSLPLAVVDGDDAPAEYAASHARVRLAAAGPSLLIGLVTGRMVVSDGDGRTLALGRCTRLGTA